MASILGLEIAQLGSSHLCSMRSATEFRRVYVRPEDLMEKLKRERFATTINSRIDELKKQLTGRDIVGDPVSPNSAIGRLSRVDAMQQQEMRLALVRQKREEMERLENAMRLIETGKYGVCNGCGEDIPDKRLDAVPDAQMCVPCLTEIQRG